MCFDWFGVSVVERECMSEATRSPISLNSTMLWQKMWPVLFFPFATFPVSFKCWYAFLLGSLSLSPSILLLRLCIYLLYLLFLHPPPPYLLCILEPQLCRPSVLKVTLSKKLFHFLSIVASIICD